MLLVTFIELPIAIRLRIWARDELQVVTAKFEEDFTARHEIRNLGAAAIQTKKFVEAALAAPAAPGGRRRCRTMHSARR